MRNQSVGDWRQATTTRLSINLGRIAELRRHSSNANAKKHLAAALLKGCGRLLHLRICTK